MIDEEILKQLEKQIQRNSATKADKALHYAKLFYQRQSKFNSALFSENNQAPSDQIPQDGSVVRGSAVFSKKCMSCHSLNTNSKDEHKMGPALGFIYNRRMGSDPYFNSYTSLLFNSNKFWTQVQLYRFLAQPQLSQCMIGSEPLSSQKDRADVIKFLKEFKKRMQFKLMNQSSKTSSRLIALKQKAHKAAIQLMKQRVNG